MSRITVTITVSLPPEMMQELEWLRDREHRTRSELIREALRRYFEVRFSSQLLGGPES
jgi:metal-responsive CopG/Arc/MetJ family transcriptional regulator